MAATRGTVQGFQRDGGSQQGQQSALGHGHVTAKAATWRTFAEVTVWKDGQVDIEVKRDGVRLHHHTIGVE